VSSLDAITRRLRDHSRADFAFILTRKGRLLTADAPAEMPEAGRSTCVDAARDAQAAVSVFVKLTMAREELVPFGGAAPVDVFVAPCGEAVVCLVMATWTDNSDVGPAFEEHLPELSELLAQAKASRAPKRTGKTIAPPPRAKTQPPPAATAEPARCATSLPSSRGRGRKSDIEAAKAPRTSTPRAPSARPPTMRPPAGRSPSQRPRALAGLVEMSKSGVRASERMQSSPTIKMRSERPRPPPLPGSLAGSVPTLGGVPLGGRGSLPNIEIGEAPLGRDSLAAIEADGRARGSLPAIELGEAQLGRESLAAIDAEGRGTGGSLPSIEVGEAQLGRESLAAIDTEGRYRGSMPSIEVGQAPLGRASLAAIEADAMRKRSLTPAEIQVGEALLGRASIDAIEDDARPSRPDIHVGQAHISDASHDAILHEQRGEVPRGEVMTSSPDIEVGLTTQAEVGTIPPPAYDGRQTQPWAEAPEDAVRAARAAKAFSREPKQGPPRMKTIPAPAPALELTPPPATSGLKSRKRKQNSNVDLWHQALDGMLLPGAVPGDLVGGAADDSRIDLDRDMSRDTIEDESTDPATR